MAGRERCMIFANERALEPVMRNRRPSGPICSCGDTQILCECKREMDREKCCRGCEHSLLPPDIRVEPSPPPASGSRHGASPHHPPLA